jgi:hypothetical protein
MRHYTLNDLDVRQFAPGVVHVVLPSGDSVGLDADDLERLGFLMRDDEPEPPASGTTKGPAAADPAA